LERVLVESTPDVKAPVVAVALPGIGNVGLIALGLLLKFSDGKRFGAYCTKNFPDHVVIGENGVCHLPRFDLFSSRFVEPNIVIVMSETPILSEESKSHYDVLDEIVRFALEMGSCLVVAVDGVAAVSGKSDLIYASATKPKLVKEFERFGAKRYEAARLPGPVGLIIGLSKYYGLNGVGVLGSATSFLPDNEAGKRVYEFLLKALNLRRVEAPADAIAKDYATP